MFIITVLVAIFTISYSTLSLAHPLSSELRAQSLTSATGHRFTPADKISPDSISSLLSTRKQANGTKPPSGTIPRGYTFDPCRYHSNCVGDRLCVGANLDRSCSGRAECFCLGESIQLCERHCKECENYPNETCGYLREDLETNTKPMGICVSKFTIFEGLLVEIGCNSFPINSTLAGYDNVEFENENKV